MRVFGVVVLLCSLSSFAEAEPKKRPAEAAGFDRVAAAAALGEVNLQKCRATNAARGSGHVTITFGPSGSVDSALIDKGPWAGTPVGKCMLGAFKKVKIPAFKGGPVTVGKSFEFA